ncbi:hypothetical protein ACKVEX_12515 [Rhodocyclaceae bacterium SMB388]
MTDSREVAAGSAELLNPIPTVSAQKIPLCSADEIRAEMARVYRDMRRGMIETQDGTRLAYVLDRLLKAREAADTEKRIEMLEAALRAHHGELKR